jgi:hypothetical protein
MQPKAKTCAARMQLPIGILKLAQRQCPSLAQPAHRRPPAGGEHERRSGRPIGRQRARLRAQVCHLRRLASSNARRRQYALAELEVR